MKGRKMTPAQIKTIKRSFALIHGQRERAAGLFFFHLFDVDPKLRLLFPGDLKRRGAKLMHGVAMIVEDLHRLHIFVPALEALAVRYVDYGLELSHYDAFGEALSRTARSLLGLGFTPELEAALEAAYGEITSVMMDAAAIEDYRLAA
jgi:hemoglobin-like flavoprotein